MVDRTCFRGLRSGSIGGSESVLLHDVFAFHATARPDLVFAVDGDRTVTYGEALGAARRLAGALVRSGVGPGDRFGVVGPNSVEHALVYYGASMAGAVPVPCNPRLAPAELAFVLADCGARALLADATVADLRVGGNFRWSNAEGFARLLEQGFPVRVERHPERIVLHAR